MTEALLRDASLNSAIDVPALLSSEYDSDGGETVLSKSLDQSGDFSTTPLHAPVRLAQRSTAGRLAAWRGRRPARRLGRRGRRFGRGRRQRRPGLVRLERQRHRTAPIVEPGAEHGP